MERSAELEQLVHEWWRSFSSGDGAWFEHHISSSEQVRLVGTDPSDWQEGAHVRGFLSTAVSALDGALSISPGDPAAFQEGSVGWAVARPTVTLPEGREVTLRWTAVFHREDGEWRAVQIHGSIGVPDAEVFGSEA